MKISNYFLLAIGGVVIGGASGFAWRAFDHASRPDITTPVESVQQVDVLPSFAYTDLDGRRRSSNEFTDKVVVLNFWATWCPPCRKETPEFVALQEAFAGNVQFMGIAIDDEDPVRDFADSYGVNYPILMGDIEAISLSRRLGNRYEGLPFTVVTKPGGSVVLRHAGGLERSQLEPLLRKLTAPG